jgi:CRP-like cAMP-binding protein
MGSDRSSLQVPTYPIEEALKAHPFTRGLRADSIDRLAEIGQVRDMAEGSYLWRQGETPPETYLLVRGQVLLEIAVPHEGKVVIESVGAGEMAGCAGLIRSSRSGFDARANTAVRLVAMDAVMLRALCAQEHELGYELLRRCANTLALRLEACRRRLIEAHRLALP